MLEKFMTNGANDYRQRYEGTFGFFQTDSKREVLVKLTRVVTDVDNPYIEFVDQNGFNYRLNADQDRGFTFIPPKSNWYNVEDGAVFVVRKPARQWTRGVCSRNTAIKFLKAGMTLNQAVDFPMLEQIFAPKKQITLEQAIKENKSFALSPDFVACFTTNSLLVAETYLGKFEIRDGVYYVSLEEKDHWATEIADVFRRNGLKMELT
jgi:hypothetical protein